jgi:hypothetical protein
VKERDSGKAWPLLGCCNGILAPERLDSVENCRHLSGGCRILSLDVQSHHSAPIDLSENLRRFVKPVGSNFESRSAVGFLGAAKLAGWGVLIKPVNLNPPMHRIRTVGLVAEYPGLSTAQFASEHVAFGIFVEAKD